MGGDTYPNQIVIPVVETLHSAMWVLRILWVIGGLASWVGGGSYSCLIGGVYSRGAGGGAIASCLGLRVTSYHRTWLAPHKSLDRQFRPSFNGNGFFSWEL